MNSPLVAASYLRRLRGGEAVTVAGRISSWRPMGKLFPTLRRENE
jgi:hypothetical protein